MGGITGILIVVILVLIFTGANKLPKLGEGLGRTIRNFKRSLNEPDEIDVTPRNQGKDDKGETPRQ
ncbi:MAG: twin-arginine translocase TatA/TatE family subunit [Humidesulfovibrio sp.]|uniref:twin-arginine translocase TatA/TatE family subunit n=1 Tax=Humidesulfovibrio sp. TaxID=2910988 RepID=UPI0027EDCE49|nr:twin-arginine translocase TatA/TatE family subunit [Humidesulfovibrio sp.]MDQ7835924.1 twin-arginine translocase TatA/TatE family subunit [Humidesulfovibrio sp.]